MKKYLAPEFEEVKYDVDDCLATSGGSSTGENNQGNAGLWNDEDSLF